MVILYIILGILGVLLLLVLAAVIRTLMTPAKSSDWQPGSDTAREKIYA